MSNTAINIQGISKYYRLGKTGSGRFREDLQSWVNRLRRMSQTAPGNHGIWALKDIDLQVEEGEVIGFVGNNGAGKSTLLKIICRITAPTQGSITGQGRIGSLLEVGTGFHGELTGRENIFLNGSILGMKKREIESCFDEIVDFSGVEKFIDTPVKRYSSGMYTRLAFAVAAHLEPEILIVDEVLAVGDAAFQRKCMGKMKEASQQKGKTVLFVSHNMAAINNLCTSGLLLINGQVRTFGKIESVISQYQETNANKIIELSDLRRKGEGSCRITSIKLLDKKNVEKSIFKLGDSLRIVLDLIKLIPQSLENVRIIIGIYNLSDEGYLRFDSKVTDSKFTISGESARIICHIDEHLNIKPDIYSINIAVFNNNPPVNMMIRN